MPDPQPPQLPDSAPQELKDFIACRTASVTLGGTIDWLPGVPVNPDFNVTPGATPSKATITVTIGAPPFGATYELPAEVADGQLKIDTSKLDVGGPSIDSFVNDLNAWLKFNGQCLGPAKVRDGKVTLTKQPCPPAATSTTPPPPQPPPVTPEPTATKAEDKGSGCGIPFIGFLIALAALLIVGILGAVQLGIFTGGPPSSTPTSSPSSTPTATAAASATSSLAASQTASAPAVSASASASLAPTSSATTAAFDLEAAQALLDEAGWKGDLATVAAHSDAAGDLYLPDSGGPATAIQQHVDLLGALAFKTTATPDMLAWLTDFGCDQTGDVTNSREWTFHMACNQTTAPPPGDYVIVVTNFAATMPQPFPAGAMCSFSVQSDVDNDRATGFASSLPHNYLIGADLYHELLFFTDSTGVAQNYILATDQSRPPRTDTGQLQGNLPTAGRALWSQDDGTQVWFVPAGQLGTAWSTGGFCTTDRAHMGPANLAVDALGQPGSAEFGLYYNLEPKP